MAIDIISVPLQPTGSKDFHRHLKLTSAIKFQLKLHEAGKKRGRSNPTEVSYSTISVGENNCVRPPDRAEAC